MATLFEHYDVSEAFGFALRVEIIHAAMLFATTVFYKWCESVRAFEKYRVRLYTPQDARLTRATIINLAVGQLGTVPFLMAVVWPVLSWRGVSAHGALPGLAVAALQVAGSMVTEDALFYWGHRLLHHRWIYRFVHKKHHQYANTVSYAAEYAHVADQILANAVPTYSGPLLFCMHPSVIYFWMFIRLWETFDAHSGYELPWSPWRWLHEVQGGLGHHDFHHSHNTGSYGSFFVFWDWAMGTDVKFKEFQRAGRDGQDARLAAALGTAGTVGTAAAAAVKDGAAKER